MDFEALASDLIRHLRGKRSQKALSRRLGYSSNVVYLWESGRAWPTTAKTLWLAERSGVNVISAVERFYGHAPPWLPAGKFRGDERYRALVPLLLDDLRGHTSTVSLARASGYGRFAVSRWLNGEAQPRLPDFLAVFEAASLRLLDFIATLVDPAQLPAAAKEWQRLQGAREAAYELPWSHAILRALELRGYAELTAHQPGWLGKRVGLDESQERECLDALRRGGQIRWVRNRWQPTDVGTIDTRNDPDKAAMLKQWWSRVGAERLGEAIRSQTGHAGYNVFTVSRADRERLIELQRAYFREMRQLIAASQPAEVVMLASTQLLDLEADSRHERPDREVAVAAEMT